MAGDPTVNLLNDGSFESHNVSGSSDNVSSVGGWETDARYIQLNEGGNVDATQGNNHLEIDRTSNTSIYQDVSTDVGSTYSIEFDYDFNLWSGSSGDPVVDVYWGGEKIDTLTAEGSGWQTFSYDVTATDSTSRLEFKASDGNNADGYIDNVKLNWQSDTVAEEPEPEPIDTTIDTPINTILGDLGSNDDGGIGGLLGGIGDAVENLTGLELNDNIVGTAASDLVYGLDGDDTIDAGAGSDTVWGWSDNDTLNGGEGNDLMSGDAGDDIVRGEGGNDQIFGGTGDDQVFGGDGVDMVGGDEGNDTLYGGAGGDTISGGAGNDTLYAGDNTSTTKEPIAYWRLGESSGNNVQDSVGGHTGTYVNGVNLGVEGGFDNQGNSAADFDGKNDYVIIPHSSDFLLDNATIQLWINPDDTKGDQTIFSKDHTGYETGGHFNLALDGDGLTLRMQTDTNGYEWDSPSDIINAGEWQHIAVSFGNQGVTVYVNGAAVISESYVGGWTDSAGGNEEPITIGASLRSNSNSDNPNNVKQYFNGQIDEVAIFDEQLNADEITTLYEAGASDITQALTTDSDVDILIGGEGNDQMFGDGGDDQFFAGAGDDTMSGGSGNDYFEGGSGDDTIDGGAGHDYIQGGDGADQLTSGAGYDEFVYTNINQSTTTSRDSIKDFTKGNDIIQITGLGFNGIQAGAASGGVLGYTHANGKTIISADNSDFSIELDGEINLDSGDFTF